MVALTAANCTWSENKLSQQTSSRVVCRVFSVPLPLARWFPAYGSSSKCTPCHKPLVGKSGPTSRCYVTRSHSSYVLCACCSCSCLWCRLWWNMGGRGQRSCGIWPPSLLGPLNTDFRTLSVPWFIDGEIASDSIHLTTPYIVSSIFTSPFTQTQYSNHKLCCTASEAQFICIGVSSHLRCWLKLSVIKPGRDCYG